MKLLTIAFLGIAATLARAERVDVGGYFSMNVPAAWAVTVSGRHLHEQGDYTVYATSSYSCRMNIKVVNPPQPDNGINFATYAMITDADIPGLAAYNKRVGWSAPAVKKDAVNGIPVLLFRYRNGNVRFLEVQAWVADKHFVMHFVYTPKAIAAINALIQSMQPLQAAPTDGAGEDPGCDPAIVNAVEGQEI